MIKSRLPKGSFDQSALDARCAFCGFSIAMKFKEDMLAACDNAGRSVFSRMVECVACRGETAVSFRIDFFDKTTDSEDFYQRLVSVTSTRREEMYFRQLGREMWVSVSGNQRFPARRHAVDRATLAEALLDMAIRSSASGVCYLLDMHARKIDLEISCGSIPVVDGCVPRVWVVNAARFRAGRGYDPADMKWYKSVGFQEDLVSNVHVPGTDGITFLGVPD